MTDGKLAKLLLEKLAHLPDQELLKGMTIYPAYALDIPGYTEAQIVDMVDTLITKGFVFGGRTTPNGFVVYSHLTRGRVCLSLDEYALADEIDRS